MERNLAAQFGRAGELNCFLHSRTGRVFLTVSGSALVALCAYISVPLYFTPVPVTLQTMAVIFLGMSLGPVLGLSAMLLYLAEGALGFPVFSPHGPGGVAQLIGPTGGYLLSYPIAAVVAGWVVRRLPSTRWHFGVPVLSALIATGIIFAAGAAWLSLLLHLNFESTWRLAVLPFLPGEILKIAATAGAYNTFRGRRIA